MGVEATGQAGQGGVLQQYGRQLKAGAKALWAGVAQHVEEARHAPTYKDAYRSMASLGEQVGGFTGGISGALVTLWNAESILGFDPTHVAGHAFAIFGGGYMGKMLGGMQIPQWFGLMKQKEMENLQTGKAQLAKAHEVLGEAVKAAQAGTITPEQRQLLEDPRVIQQVGQHEVKMAVDEAKLIGGMEGAAFGGAAAGAAGGALFAADGFGVLSSGWQAGKELVTGGTPSLPVSTHTVFGSLGLAFVGGKVGSYLGRLAFGIVGGGIGCALRLVAGGPETAVEPMVAMDGEGPAKAPGATPAAPPIQPGEVENTAPVVAEVKS